MSKNSSTINNNSNISVIENGYKVESTCKMSLYLSYNRVSRTTCIEVLSLENYPNLMKNGIKGNLILRFVLLPHNVV